MHSVLFIGGVRDGEQRTLYELRPEIQVMVAPKKGATLSVFEIDSGIVFEKQYYTLRKIVCETAIQNLYVIHDMPTDAAMQQLVNHYKPGKPND